MGGKPSKPQGGFAGRPPGGLNPSDGGVGPVSPQKPPATSQGTPPSTTSQPLSPPVTTTAEAITTPVETSPASPATASDNNNPSADPSNLTGPSTPSDGAVASSVADSAQSASSGGIDDGGQSQSSHEPFSSAVGAASQDSDPRTSALTTPAASTSFGNDNLTLAGDYSTATGSDTSSRANPTFNPTVQAAASGSHVKSAAIVAGVIVPLFVLLLAGAGYLAYRRRRRLRDREEWMRTHEEIADAVRQVGPGPPLSAWARLDNASQGDLQYSHGEQTPTPWHNDTEPLFYERSV